MSSLKAMFEDEVSEAWRRSDEPHIVVVAVELPNGAIETITNTQHLHDKMRYYIEAYDKDFRLISNPNVRIVNYMIV